MWILGMAIECGSCVILELSWTWKLEMIFLIVQENHRTGAWMGPQEVQSHWPSKKQPQGRLFVHLRHRCEADWLGRPKNQLLRLQIPWDFLVVRAVAGRPARK